MIRKSHLAVGIILSILGMLLILTSACQISGSGISSKSSSNADIIPDPIFTQPVIPTELMGKPSATDAYQFSGETIQLAWFYNPPVNGNLEELARKFDVFILTKNYNGEREILKSHGVAAPFIKYLAFFEIQDMPCDEQPWQNNVAYKIGDFCTITNNHADWFLTGENNGFLCTEGFCMMDPGNQEWLDFWLQRAIETQTDGKWDGVFMDNVEASLGKRLDEDLMPSRYRNDKSYQAMIEGALKYIYQSYFQPTNRPLYANIISVNDWDVWLSYLKYLDGAMIEDFAVDWDSGYRSSEEWEAQMDAITKAQAMGKSLILVSQGERNDLNRQKFSLASYLLVNDGKASFRYTEDEVYDEIWWYDNYNLDLGKPKGTRYLDGTTWKRDFTNGSVLVDPVTRKANININP